MSDNQNGSFDDIQDADFDEKLEIEKLQETIRNMSLNVTNDDEGFVSQSPAAIMGMQPNLLADSDEFDPYAAIEKPVVRNSGPKAKKFVVMVNADNVEYFDKIPMEERNKLFNTLLTQHKNNKTLKKQKEHLAKLAKHLIVGIFTILLSLPIMFVVVNKSIEMTINNYKDVQNSFEKLYEQRNQDANSTRKRTIY